MGGGGENRQDLAIRGLGAKQTMHRAHPAKTIMRQGGEMSDLMSDRKDVSNWALGGAVFAATVMIMTGLFQVFEGLAALINDDFYVVLPNYAYEVDITAWGWIHLIIGIVVIVAGVYLFSGNRAAGVAAILLAALSAVSNFLFIPYYPLWSLLLIALAVFVIWSVSQAVLKS